MRSKKFFRIKLGLTRKKKIRKSKRRLRLGGKPTLHQRSSSYLKSLTSKPTDPFNKPATQDQLIAELDNMEQEQEQEQEQPVVVETEPPQEKRLLTRKLKQKRQQPPPPNYPPPGFEPPPAVEEPKKKSISRRYKPTPPTFAPPIATPSLAQSNATSDIASHAPYMPPFRSIMDRESESQPTESTLLESPPDTLDVTELTWANKSDILSKTKMYESSKALLIYFYSETNPESMKYLERLRRAISKTNAETLDQNPDMSPATLIRLVTVNADREKELVKMFKVTKTPSLMYYMYHFATNYEDVMDEKDIEALMAKIKVEEKVTVTDEERRLAAVYPLSSEDRQTWWCKFMKKYYPEKEINKYDWKRYSKWWGANKFKREYIYGSTEAIVLVVAKGEIPIKGYDNNQPPYFWFRTPIKIHLYRVARPSCVLPQDIPDYWKNYNDLRNVMKPQGPDNKIDSSKIIKVLNANMVNVNFEEMINTQYNHYREDCYRKVVMKTFEAGDVLGDKRYKFHRRVPSHVAEKDSRQAGSVRVITRFNGDDERNLLLYIEDRENVVWLSEIITKCMEAGLTEVHLCDDSSSGFSTRHKYKLPHDYLTSFVGPTPTRYYKKKHIGTTLKLNTYEQWENLDTAEKMRLNSLGTMKGVNRLSA